MAKPVSAIKTQTVKNKSTPASPTIGGVGGIGVKTTTKRPDSSRRPSVVYAHHTKPTHFGEETVKKTVEENRESEQSANRQLSSTSRMKLLKIYNQKNGMSGYTNHNAAATKKKPVESKGRNIYEDAPTMSVGANGGNLQVTDPTTNYAAGVKKKLRDRTSKK